MAFGTSTDVQDHCGAGPGIGQAKQLIAWKSTLSEAEADCSLCFHSSSARPCWSFHLTWKLEGVFKGVKGSSLQMELELLSYEGTLSTSDVSFYHARRRRDLGHPFLFSTHIWCDQSQFCLCCWEAFNKSGCCQSWSQVPDPRRRYAAGPCALREKVLVVKSSFPADRSLRSKAIYWHPLYETNTDVWVTRERLLRCLNIICCTEGRGPICYAYLLVLYCAFAFQTMVSLFVSTSWSHRTQMQSSGLRSKCALDYY